MLWNLYGNSAGMAFRSWKTTVKIAWGVDRATHTYFVYHLLARDMIPLRQQILRRYVKFVTGLLYSFNPVVTLLAVLSVNTVQSNTGWNIHKMKEEFGMDPLKTSRNEFVVEKSDIPAGGEDDLILLQDLMTIRSNEVDDDIISELDALIRNTCTK